jgi:hypothetical protein
VTTSLALLGVPPGPAPRKRVPQSSEARVLIDNPAYADEGMASEAAQGTAGCIQCVAYLLTRGNPPVLSHLPGCIASQSTLSQAKSTASLHHASGTCGALPRARSGESGLLLDFEEGWWGQRPAQSMLSARGKAGRHEGLKNRG